jgi:hypothetical protein
MKYGDARYASSEIRSVCFCYPTGWGRYNASFYESKSYCMGREQRLLFWYRFTAERVGGWSEIQHPFREISHMPTLLYGVVFGEINTQIFSWRQFPIEYVVKAFIWINTECLIVKIEDQVTTIPNGGVPFGSHYSPRPIRHHQHG